MRLDQFIARQLGLAQKDARLRILRGEVEVNGSPERRHQFEVSKFTTVRYRERSLRKGVERIYLVFHKPVGILSATKDKTHKTVLDFIDCPDRDSLHLAGRLDRSSSGLILLTNDGQWSESFTDPERKVEKHYLVETDRPIPPSAVRAFAEGFEFHPEGIVTRPAQLVLLSPCRASVTLQEGRYHQIKRMFHRLDGIRLVSLHRDRIGAIHLPDDLMPGEFRRLTGSEIQSPQES